MLHRLPEIVSKIVMTCCVLRNICCRNCFQINVLFSSISLLAIGDIEFDNTHDSSCGGFELAPASYLVDRINKKYQSKFLTMRSIIICSFTFLLT